MTPYQSEKQMGSNASLPSAARIGRGEMRRILSDLKILFEEVEFGDADALQEVRERAEQGTQLLDQLDELLMASQEKLNALREVFDGISVAADDQDQPPEGAEEQ